MAIRIREQGKCLVIELGDKSCGGERWYFAKANAGRKTMFGVISTLLDIKERYGHRADFKELLENKQTKK